MLLLGAVAAGVVATEDAFLSEVAVILVDKTGARRFISLEAQINSFFTSPF